MKTFCLGKEPELKITICKCGGGGKGYWREGQRYKVSIFVPLWFLREIDRFPTKVREKFVVCEEKLHACWGNIVYLDSDRNPEQEFESCAECPHAPEKTRYKNFWVYSEGEEREEVEQALNVLREAYNFYLSRAIKIHEQRTYIITIAYEPKDRVEVLKQLIEGENEA